MNIFLIIITLCGSPQFIIGHSDSIDMYGEYKSVSKHPQFPEAISTLLSVVPVENLIEMKIEDMNDDVICT